jgi:hypothetical protein
VGAGERVELASAGSIEVDAIYRGVFELPGD